MSESTTIKWDKGDDGIVTLTMDDPNQSANTMNEAYKASMGATVDRLEAEKDDITGVILTSAKSTFFAGGDLNDLIQATPADAPRVSEEVREIKAQLRRLETLGKPVVAAINGAALGGGLEIALACHHRIAVDSPKVQLGFPEVQLGLLPGGGGVVRTTRLLGITNALMQWLLQGKRYRPAQAKEFGLLDELVVGRGRAGPGGQEVDRRQPRGRAALRRQGLQDPGRHAVQPQAGDEPAGLPGQPAQADQGRQLPRAAPHHVGVGRGRAGGLRLGHRDRGPLLHRPGHAARCRRT